MSQKRTPRKPLDPKAANSIGEREARAVDLDASEKILGEESAYLERARLAASKPPKYDPSKDREGLRGTIAVWLLVILTVIIIGSLAAAICKPESFPLVKDILAILVGLISTVIGFYFGQSSAR